MVALTGAADYKTATDKSRKAHVLLMLADSSAVDLN